jgi:hypothetical protein
MDYNMAARHFAGETLAAVKKFCGRLLPLGKGAEISMVRYTAFVPHDTGTCTPSTIDCFCTAVSMAMH